MEQPPGGLTDLLPQDLSDTSRPAALDLTRKADLSNKSKDAMRVVRCPGWHQSTGTNNGSISCSKTSTTDVALQSVAQVKPDNAFSHTTVTLSYVSRSHIYPSVDAQTKDTSLCTAPPTSTFSPLRQCQGKRDVCENGYHSHHSESPDETQKTFPWLNGEVISSGVEDHSETTVEKQANSPPMGMNSDMDVLANSSNGASAFFREKDKRTREMNVPLLSSMNQDCVTVPDNEETRDQCSLTKDYTSPPEDPLTPPATSVDDVEDVLILPRASSSPSTVSSFQEAANAIAGNPDLLSSTEVETKGSRLPRRSQRQKFPSKNLFDLTDEICLFGYDEDERKLKVKGNAKTRQRNRQVKKLPARSGRGVNLDSCTVPRQVKTVKASPKKRAGSKTETDLPMEKVTQTSGISLRNAQTDALKISTSDSEVISQTEQANASLYQKKPQVAAHKTLRKKSECLSPTPLSEAVNASKISSPSPRVSPKKQSSSPRGKATTQKTSTPPKTKAAKTPRRRKRLIQSPASSMFSPREPDIKLKYLNYKEERKDYRLINFSPFIHVERRPSSTALCTVVNEPEEIRPQQLQKGQRQQVSPVGTYVSTTVPCTSCLQLGRVSTQSQCLRPFVCCLCQLSANAMDLGDLLGPYYSEGYQPRTSAVACTSGILEDKDSLSDSDSSSSCVSAKRRKWAVPHTTRSHRQAGQQKQKAPTQFCHMTKEECDSPGSKRSRSDGDAGDDQDWFSPPVLPMQACEYWLHEECGIWAAGVYLVKGKVYGLEEAVKIARVTMCSACRTQGATLGCFFKGCPNKYHYRCALQSDCILIEENFSMKCKKHKNKTLNDPVGKGQNRR